VRHRLLVVVSAAVCAVVAGCRSYTAIAKWIDDVPAATMLALGINPDRRPSETVIRRLLQALDPHLLTAAIGDWLTGRATTTERSRPRNKRSRSTARLCAAHAAAAALPGTSSQPVTRTPVSILASTDVDRKTNEITPAAIGALRITIAGATNIAAANRHHARDSTRPPALLGII
jgi:hypothetical protein